VEERRLGMQREVIHVTENRDNRGDSAAGCEEDNPVLGVFVELESAEWPVRLDSQSKGRALIQESRHASRRLLFHGNLDKPSLCRRRRYRKRPAKFLSIEEP